MTASYACPSSSSPAQPPASAATPRCGWPAPATGSWRAVAGPTRSPSSPARAGSVEAARVEVERRTAGAGLDVLVNNAGYALPGPLETLTEADLRLLFDTNVFGLLAVTRAFLPRMRERGAGRVVNVGSVMGRVTMPLLGAYNASKHAVAALTDALRMELAPFGVRVVLVEPGAVRSGFAARALQGLAPYRDPGSPYARAVAGTDAAWER